MALHRVCTRFYFWFYGIAAFLALATLAFAGFPQLSSQEIKQRDRWQRPERVLDALALRAGSVVADVGAGDGYFTFHLADRVGPSGKVYAVDVLDKELEKIRSAAAKHRLIQIETVLGSSSDPRLPADTLDAVLIMNAFHEMEDFDDMLQALNCALKPGGLLAIIEAEDKMGEPRSVYQKRHKLPEEIVRQDAARNGFHFLRKLPGFSNPQKERSYYFLLFERPKAIS